MEETEYLMQSEQNKLRLAQSIAQVEKLNQEILAMHRKLAAAELEATNYKQRYEASNTKYLVKEKELMNLKYPSVPTNKLTAQELINEGYGHWELNNGDTIYLIPLIKLDSINPDMLVTCITGGKILAKDMDLDTRGGMLAYGVYPA